MWIYYWIISKIRIHQENRDFQIEDIAATKIIIDHIQSKTNKKRNVLNNIFYYSTK